MTTLTLIVLIRATFEAMALSVISSVVFHASPAQLFVASFIYISARVFIHRNYGLHHD